MIKIIKFQRIIIAMSLFLALYHGAVIARGDAFDQIQYNQVFDQTTIYKKYRKLMYKLGCADNVFQSDISSDSITKKSGDPSDQSAFIDKYTTLPFDPVRDRKELAAFEKECMDRLHNARRLSIITPTIEGLSDVAFMAVIAGSMYAASTFTPDILAYFKRKEAEKPELVIKDNSTQNAITSTIITTLFALKGLVGAGYNLMYWPDNSLESLENHFAKNKCYIPRALWPKIEKEFMAARQDSHNRQLHTHFIDFALGFTVYKPKPALRFKDEMSIHDVKNELNARIDAFFGNYKDNKDTIDINYIKINVSKFIDLLVHNSSSKVVQGPRYLYLYGSGGIGKTHFVQTLSDWIDELVPHSVRFEDVIINSPTDLEGSEQSSGAFLKALRNQLIQNKRGSVIMMDEATWLNYGSMISPAKRIFNGDRSKLVTSYFGTNMDGRGVSLEIPPMLIFVASNEPIADPALESRFDIILYPTPSQQALFSYGVKVAENSEVLKQAHCDVNKDLIALWVQSFDEKHRNFRFVAGNVEALLLTNKQANLEARATA
ncbi:MAG: hypothetical protein Q8Q60_03830 [Candidatus Chromulinivorax sp.]|nr:hypothetical protein [Candidatus Chromulinivorax sp.]